MLKMKELDELVSFEKQLQENIDGPVVLGILFTMASEDVEAFKTAWAMDAASPKLSLDSSRRSCTRVSEQARCFWTMRCSRVLPLLKP